MKSDNLGMDILKDEKLKGDYLKKAADIKAKTLVKEVEILDLVDVRIAEL